MRCQEPYSASGTFCEFSVNLIKKSLTICLWRWESNPLSSKATVLQTAPALQLWRSPIFTILILVRVEGVEPTTF